jgi:hypothetical protein
MRFPASTKCATRTRLRRSQLTFLLSLLQDQGKFIFDNSKMHDEAAKCVYDMLTTIPSLQVCRPADTTERLSFLLSAPVTDLPTLIDQWVEDEGNRFGAKRKARTATLDDAASKRVRDFVKKERKPAVEGGEERDWFPAIATD